MVEFVIRYRKNSLMKASKLVLLFSEYFIWMNLPLTSYVCGTSVVVQLLRRMLMFCFCSLSLNDVNCIVPRTGWCLFIVSTGFIGFLRGEVLLFVDIVLSRCLSRAVRWWRTLMRSTKRRRRKKKTRTGPRRSSSLSTLRTRWWCGGPVMSPCKHLAKYIYFLLTTALKEKAAAASMDSPYLFC